MRLHTLSVLAILAGACSRAGPHADLRAISGQNVLLITIDTLRADALGAYGGRAATPALDRLAAEGVRFDFAHAHAVVTLTSHASILTGQYPYQHGLRDNIGYRLPKDAPTLATRLKAAGYATAAFVAAFPLHSRFGLSPGFDTYDDRFGESTAPTEFVMPERPASAVVPLARQWIATDSRLARRDPWFVWLHVFDPHAPYRPPPPFDAQYADRPYDGEVAATDAALAPLLDDVRRLERPTLVVVTGDHGEALGDHGEQTHGLFAYESTLRVPLIIAQLGAVRLKADMTTAARANATRVASALSRTDTAPGSRVGEVSSISARHVDILPTILEAVGLPKPGGLPGRSLLTIEERRAPPPPSYFEAMSGLLNRGAAPLTGVLVDRDKLVDVPIQERYDLRSDPGERVNLAGRAPDRDRALLAVLSGFSPASPGPRVAESPEATARLRALGYVSGSGARKATYSEADDPKRFVALDADMHRAIDAFSSGRADEAIGIYRRVIAERSDYALAYRHLAFVERQRGRIAGAVDVLQRAVQAGVRQPAILIDLAGDLADTGRGDEAIRLIEPLASSPDVDADALNTLGIAYARAGRRADAQRTFERVLAINPGSSVPLENLGMLALESGDLKAARNRFERAVASQPRSSRAYSGLGVAALRAGDRRGAIDAWTRAVQLDPTNFDALYNVATTLARAGDMAAARPYLEQFLRTAPPSYDRDKREIARLLGR